MTNSIPIWDAITRDELFTELFNEGCNKGDSFQAPETRKVTGAIDIINEILLEGLACKKVVGKVFNIATGTITLDYKEDQIVVFNPNSFPIEIQNPLEKHTIDAGAAMIVGNCTYQLWTDDEIKSPWNCILVGKIE